MASRNFIRFKRKGQMKPEAELIKNLGQGRIKTGEPLSLHTTFKIGGPAQFYFEAREAKEIISAINLCRRLNLSYFILGGGSNLLVSDEGFPGLVIKNKSQKIRVLGYQGKIQKSKRKISRLFIEAESGVLVNTLVRYTIEEDLTGLEEFLGLPGTVGGAIYLNAHSKDNFIGDYLASARILTKESEIKQVENSYFRFAYDQSILSKTGDVLLAAVFQLKGGENKTLWEKAQEALVWRQKNHHYDLPSAGCIFRNIQKSEALRLGTPNQTQSAGFLIEAVGLKGKTIGGAQISPNHANFIVNLGGAQAPDVIKLIDLAKAKVKEKFGINLQEEIIYLGPAQAPNIRNEGGVEILNG